MANVHGLREYLKLRAFVRRCPVSESTIRRWIRLGILEYTQPGGPDTTILIPADALDQFDTSVERVDSHSKLANTISKPIPGRKPKWKADR
jgi:hypothetical protein